VREDADEWVRFGRRCGPLSGRGYVTASTMPIVNISTAIAPRTNASRSFSDIPAVGAERMKRLILPPPRPPDVSRTFGGRSFVVALYAVIVALTGVVGAALGAFGPDNLTAVRLLGLVELAPTPLGLALYGVVTVGLALGVPLALVAYVSRRAGSGAADGPESER
jgi:hypothetical protein